MIDPLDGTTNFAHGFPFYSVSIAVERDGECIVGVVLDPVRDEIFTAARGEGAFLNGEPIHVSHSDARQIIDGHRVCLQHPGYTRIIISITSLASPSKPRGCDALVPPRWTFVMSLPGDSMVIGKCVSALGTWRQEL